METNSVKKVWILSAVAASALFGVLISLQGGTWENLGEGTWRNALISVSTIALVVTLTWLPVSYTRIHTVKGAVTLWRKVGKTTLFVYGTLVFTTAVAFLNIVSLTGALTVLQVTLMPSLVAFPIWTLVAAIRGKNAPNVQLVDSEMVVEDKVADPQVLAQPADLKPLPTWESVPASKTGSKKIIIVAVAIASGVVLLGAAWVGDQWVRSQELNSFLATIEPTQAASAKWFEDKEANRARPLTTDASEDLRKYLQGYKDAGSKYSVALRVIKSKTEDVGLLPWHSDIQELKTDFLDSNNAQILQADWSTTLTRDTLLLFNPHDTEVEATRLIAALTASELAIPMFAPEAGRRLAGYFGSP